jgi:hypothetical protein
MDIDRFDMRLALGHPEKCTEEVSRNGLVDTCDRVAVALRLDPNEGSPYPVCARHARRDLVPLEDIVRFLLKREEAQRMVARGLVRMAVVS